MLAEEVVPVDVLMRISFRTESDATRGIIPEQNIRGFRPMSAAMSACRNSKLCPCLLALDCWRITDYPEVIGSSVGLVPINALAVRYGLLAKSRLPVTDRLSQSRGSDLRP